MDKVEAEAIQALLLAIADLDKPEPHLFKQGRILCGGTLFAPGMSPCEITLPITEPLPPMCNGYRPRKRIRVRRAARVLSNLGVWENYVGGSM